MKKSQWKWKAWKSFSFPLFFGSYSKKKIYIYNIRNGCNGKSMKTHPYIMVLFFDLRYVCKGYKGRVSIHFIFPHMITPTTSSLSFISFLLFYIKKRISSWFLHFFVFLYIIFSFRFFFCCCLSLICYWHWLLFLLMATMMMLMAYTYTSYIDIWFNQWVIIAE